MWSRNIKEAEKKFAANKLVLAHQHMPAVCKAMLEIETADLECKEGVDNVIQKMNEYYAKRKEHVARAAFHG